MMVATEVLNYTKDVLKNIPNDWLRLTTHRLDIYNEERAKTQFLEEFEVLFQQHNSATSALHNLPTAYDYIRLGHPLSCVLEWVIAKQYSQNSENVISFSSATIPILAILRANLLAHRSTRIVYTDRLPDALNLSVLQHVYGYTFEVKKMENVVELSTFDGSTVLISQQDTIAVNPLNPNIDFYIQIHQSLGSILIVNGVHNEKYVSEIQHVRRRETIAMTPHSCLVALHSIIDAPFAKTEKNNLAANKASVLDSIQTITNASTKALVASSGLSMQYAIMMGLIHAAEENHQGKPIKFIVPPNCYGGTNDQARRVAACLDHVEVVDLPVDAGNDMAQSVENVLAKIALGDGVPYIIAEIPTNPRVEVPDLLQLKAALSKVRKTESGATAIAPVFILDQTFCPNVHFLGADDILSSVKTISYVSGSKFPSGGQCTAGYCVGNKNTDALMEKIEVHLKLCDNEATDLQMEILAKQLPSMNQRIHDAYLHTREFVNFIQDTLPNAKINFVTPELADQGFTPSVFSLDLPTKGATDQEKETYKRTLNHKLINMMITEIPDESKYCVSYGQLKGCYWTIPATSTQGTTKEADKDYIARVALSSNMNLESHKQVFLNFAESI